MNIECHNNISAVIIMSPIMPDGQRLNLQIYRSTVITQSKQIPLVITWYSSSCLQILVVLQQMLQYQQLPPGHQTSVLQVGNTCIHAGTAI